MSGTSYVVDEIRKNYDDWYWWRMRLESRVIGPVQQRVYGNDGIDVMTEDWDNLLVIDACRADIFEEVAPVDEYESYRRVTSPASATPEWMERVFADREFGDTVYVSANPWVSKIAPDSFHHIYNIWIDEYNIVEEDLADVEVLEELDVDFGANASIPADKVNDQMETAHEEYSNKRLIAHYFQPHAPYIGNSDGTEKENPSSIHPGEPLARGTVDKNAVWTEYEENLEYVLEHVHDLAEALPGRTVVTSDHGELFGEWMTPFPVRGYAHPIGLRHPAITEVPWAVINDGDREVLDHGTRQTDVADDEVNERLEDLGYKV